MLVTYFVNFRQLIDHLFGKELFIRFSASAFRKPSIYVFSYFPFGFEGRMWDLIVSVPDHCLSFYFANLITSYTFNINGQLIPSDMRTRHFAKSFNFWMTVNKKINWFYFLCVSLLHLILRFGWTSWTGVCIRHPIDTLILSQHCTNFTKNKPDNLHSQCGYVTITIVIGFVIV